MSLEVRGLTENRKALAMLHNFIQRGDRGLYEDIGDLAIELIQERTKSGKDINDRRFKPYSKRYAKRKGTQRVDLTLSGQMLKDIRRQAFKKKVRIYFLKRKRKGIKISSYDLARIQNFHTRTGRKHKALNPKREFAGLSKSDIRKLRNRFKTLFYGKIAQLTR